MKCGSKLLAVVSLITGLSACGGDDSDAGDNNIAALTSGPVQDWYYHPWSVRLFTDCGATMIAPQWALTAAHCVDFQEQIRYQRVNPHTGESHNEAVGSAVRHRALPGVIRHPEFEDARLTHDIALIKLNSPLSPAWHVQFAALPATARIAGTRGAMVTTKSLDEQLQTGEVKVLRTQIDDGTQAAVFRTTLASSEDGARLSPGDSGSGFITVEQGRAVVRGVARAEAPTINDSGAFTDVFFHRDWILETLGEDASTLSGNTRVRRRGLNAIGSVNLNCEDEWTVPLDIQGAELRVDCPDGSERMVTCEITEELPAGVAVGTNKRRIRRNLVHTFSGTSTTTQTFDPQSSRQATVTHSPQPTTLQLYECEIENPDFPASRSENQQ